MKRLALVIVGVLLCGQAFAQWQVPNGSIPTGRGPGFQGFNGISPGNNNDCLTSFGGAWIKSPCPGAATVRPEQFAGGVDICNGIADAGPAIQSAINSTGTGAVTVSYSPWPCIYNVITPITYSKRGVSHEGASPLGSFFKWSLVANGTMFTVSHSDVTPYHSFRNMWFYSSDTTHIKKMINLIDVREALIENVHCSGSVSDDTPLTGGGGTYGSVCLQTNGRDTTVIRKSTFAADSPIVIGKNPHFQTLSADHFSYENLYLIGTAAYPCVTVEDGAGLTNTSFYKQSWNVCTYGFLQNDTTSLSGMNNLVFRDMRIEQSLSPAGFGIFISPNPTGNSLRNLTVDNVQFDPAQKGIYLRGVINPTISNSFFTCSPAVVAIDAGGGIGTVDAMSWSNNFFNTACTFVSSSGGPLVKVWGTPPDLTGSPSLSASAFYHSARTAVGVYNDMIQMPKITSSGAAPGAGSGRLELLAGSVGGTCRLVLFAGTSVTPTTVIDNVGGGC